MEAHASAATGNGTSASATPTSASASLDNSLTVSAGASVGNDQLGAAIEVSAKTGTVAGAAAGLDGNNVFVEASYSDTTEAHLTVDGTAKVEGCGVSAGLDAYAKTGTEVEAHLQAGQNGVAAGAEASIGNAVGVDAEGTVALRGVEASAGAGVSIGEHLEAGGSAEATFRDGKATVALAGDVAALIGVEADVKVTVDTKQVVADSLAVAAASEKAAHVVADTSVKAADVVVSGATSVAKDAGKALDKAGKDAGNAMKKAGKGIKKAFHF